MVETINDNLLQDQKSLQLLDIFMFLYFVNTDRGDRAPPRLMTRARVDLTEGGSRCLRLRAWVCGCGKADYATH